MGQKVEDLFSDSYPIGPNDSYDLTDPAVMRLFFSTDNWIHDKLNVSPPSPSLLVGRRGSGKTAFLRMVYSSPEKYQIIAELKSHAAFDNVVREIQSLSKGVVFVENVSRIWNTLFWSLLFKEMLVWSRKQDLETKALDPVRAYCTNRGILSIESNYDIIRHLIGLMKVEDEKLLNPVQGDTLPYQEFEEARDAMSRFMAANKLRGMVLLDTVERFHLDEGSMGHAIRGLLRAQGRFHTPGSPVEARVCIPSELYFKFSDLSTAPLKDFEHQLTLHWHARELLRLAAERHRTYLGIRFGSILPDDVKTLLDIDLKDKNGPKSYWNVVFPPSITNKFGLDEDTVPYILRHTQLLPRQLIILLNSIFRENQRAGGTLYHVKPEAVVGGISKKENDLCTDIFTAYESIYPEARIICESCMRFLLLRFKEGDLLRVFNKNKGNFTTIQDFHQFRRMLIEIGAVGRVSSETERYVEGVFEYTVPNRLIMGLSDQYCIHPLFSQVFNAIEKGTENKESSGLMRAIYPYGSDPDTNEYREA